MTITMRGTPAGGDSPAQTDHPPAVNATLSQQPSTSGTSPTTSQHEETGEMEVDTDNAEKKITFPTEELERLDEMINRPRWVVPVLPKGELEVLLDSSIDLCKKGESIFQRLFHGLL